ncbi:MAG: hypothetical protein H0Z33_00700 [Bacillaceae bacterium]|nr:hypothetical protein [Bacillaceae bacterium]
MTDQQRTHKNLEERERHLPSDAPSSLPHADNAPPPYLSQEKQKASRVAPPPNETRK